MKQLKRKKLLKIVVIDKSGQMPPMELAPTKSNETKVARMAAMHDVEVRRVYEA